MNNEVEIEVLTTEKKELLYGFITHVNTPDPWEIARYVIDTRAADNPKRTSDIVVCESRASFDKGDRVMIDLNKVPLKRLHKINEQGILLNDSPRAILISIKPRFTDLIFSGAKTVELRRKFMQNHVNIGYRCYVYASAPIQKVIGYFTIDNLFRINIDNYRDYLFNRSGNTQGLTPKEYNTYFEGLERGFMLEIGTPELFPEPQPVTNFNVIRPPQNAQYIINPYYHCNNDR